MTSTGIHHEFQMTQNDRSCGDSNDQFTASDNVKYLLYLIKFFIKSFQHLLQEIPGDQMQFLVSACFC